jgi:hypothetical protein
MKKYWLVLLTIIFFGCEDSNMDGSWQRFSYGKTEGYVEFKGDSLIIEPNSIFESRHVFIKTDRQFQIKNYKNCDITFDYKLSNDTLYNLTNKTSRPFWVKVKSNK